VEEITAAANVAKGTFYQHFETKAEILLALIRRHESATVAEVERRLAEGFPPLALAQGLLRAMTHGFEKDRKMAPQAISVALAHPAKTGEPSMRMAFARAFAAAQQRGEIRDDVDASELALTLVGAMLPHIILWARKGKRGALLPAMERVWKVFLEGLAR